MKNGYENVPDIKLNREELIDINDLMIIRETDYKGYSAIECRYLGKEFKVVGNSKKFDIESNEINIIRKKKMLIKMLVYMGWLPLLEY